MASASRYGMRHLQRSLHARVHTGQCVRAVDVTSLTQSSQRLIRRREARELGSRANGGRHTRGSVGPNSATVGTSAKAATCVMPAVIADEQVGAAREIGSCLDGIFIDDRCGALEVSQVVRTEPFHLVRADHPRGVPPLVPNAYHERFHRAERAALVQTAAAGDAGWRSGCHQCQCVASIEHGGQRRAVSASACEQVFGRQWRSANRSP